MALTHDELRLMSALMLAAYAGMAGGAFFPSWRARQAVDIAVRAERTVPLFVEAMWVAVQGALVVSLLGALFAQDILRQSPATLLAVTALPVSLAGVILFLAGCVVAAWAALHLGEELTVAIQTREGGNLVTSGPYGRMRHPIYTGIILMACGNALALASPLAAGVAVAAVYAAGVRASVEEELLLSDPIHGPAYRDYQARTGRFLPRLARG